MKKTLAILACIALSTFAFAQEKETTKQQEVGVTFSNFDNFGLTYRVGNQRSMWRFNVATFSGNTLGDNPGDNDATDIAFQIGAGKEFRKKMVDKLEFRYGLDLLLGLDHSKTENGTPNPSNPFTERTSTLLAPELNLVFGFNYVISEHFVMGAEVLPFFRYNWRQNSTEFIDNSPKVENTETNYQYGFNTNSLRLSAVFRF